MKIPISEIFQSIQGEGRNTGKPSIFVRFWGCNLKCTWCDSKYSWDPTIEKADIMGFEEVVTKIKQLKTKHIIFTGGEPTLFLDQIKAIQDKLNEEGGYTYELETNGSNLINKGYFDQVNISPKLANSGNNKYSLDAAVSPRMICGNIDFKFVCKNIQDVILMEKCIAEYNLEEIGGIYVMPLGITEKSQVNDFLIKYCIKLGYNYCLRQHLIMFGDGKGK